MDVIVSSSAPTNSLARPSGTPLIELQHLLDPRDAAFARLASDHGDKVSTLADYPEFAAQFTGTTSELLSALSGGDLPDTAVRAGRCLMPPIGCGKPFSKDGVARQDMAEWRITGLCPNCQDRIDADEESDRG